MTPTARPADDLGHVARRVHHLDHRAIRDPRLGRQDHRVRGRIVLLDAEQVLGKRREVGLVGDISDLGAQGRQLLFAVRAAEGRDVEREPALPRLLRRWVLMGGAFGVPGNTTPVAEWNVHCDPEAARLAFGGWARAIEADPSQMRQLFQNLIGNALKFAAPERPLTVRIRGRQVGDRAEFTVEDNGIGFDMRYVDKLFGMFQRLHVVPGDHDLELYLDGYRSVKQHVFIQPGSTFRIRYMMEALKPGDTQDPRPVAPPRPPQPSAAAQTAAPQAGARSEFGSVAIRVQPRDAQVFIDGQRWEAPVDNERLVV